MPRLQPIARARRLPVMPYRISRRALWSAIVIAFGALVVHSGAAVQNEDAADVARLVDVLAVRPGSILADIGAGDGTLTIPMAREVGPSGRIYATELGGAPLDNLRKKIAAPGAPNVEVV